MGKIIDIEYSELFEVGDEVRLEDKCGVVVESYILDKNNYIAGGKLIILWDTSISCDFEIIHGEMEHSLSRIKSPHHKFKYIDKP